MTGVITSSPPPIEPPSSSASGNPEVLGPLSYVPAIPNLPQTWTAPQTFNFGTFQLAGSLSGALTINAPPTASGTLTLPAGTTDFSSTGGSAQVVMQEIVGGPFTVRQLTIADIIGGGGGGGQALTKADDTNVTLTLGGTPATALLAATSITVGWSGTLSAARGGFGANISAQSGVPLFASGTPTFTGTTGTGQFVRENGPTIIGPLTISTTSTLNMTSSNAGIELGNTGASNTPFIDFHSSGNAIDYDVRIIASGGSGSIGQGTLQVLAASITGPTPAVDDNTTKFATTAYVIAQASASGDGNPAANGTAARGTAIHWARADHVHPTDTSRAPATSGTAILKGNGSGGFSNASAGSDYLAPPSGTAILKANSGGALANATAGTDYLAPPSGTAILKANSGGALANATAGTDYMHPGTTSAVTIGFTVTPNSLGTISSFTVNPALGNYQYGTNNGAFTLTAPGSDSAVDILITNGASAGAITFSGFTVGSNTGDALTTTNGHKFILSIRRINSTSTYVIKELQ